MVYSPNTLPASNSFKAQEFPASEFSSLRLVTCNGFNFCSFYHLKWCKSLARTPSLFARSEVLLRCVCCLTVVSGSFWTFQFRASVRALSKMEGSGRGFEQSFSTELSRFLENVWETRACSVRNSAQRCHKLSAAAGRALAQITAAGLNVRIY